MSAMTWVRRNRAVSLVVAVVLSTLVVLTVLTVGNAARSGALDPDNPSPDGAQALARVLTDQDVEVDVVRRTTELAQAPIDQQTTVVVTGTEQLGFLGSRNLVGRASAAGAVVLAGPDQATLRAFGLPVEAAAGPMTTTTPARCDDPLVQDLTVRVSPSFGYRSTRRSSTSETCFAPPSPDAAGLVLRVDATVPTYVVGGADLLSNDQVTAADNAAVALRLLGQHERLVWFVPDPRDVAAGEAGSVAGQLPQALEPAAYLLAVALLATMIWRGRRLGPLVTEPLPVTVKAVESTQGRGRLYRRTRDRPHAADVLRAATTRRLASRLRLPAGASASLVGSAAATAVDEDPAAVDDVLVSRVITDDAALTRLAQDLAALERKVHRP